jgi:chromosome segregation ATPase
MPRTSRLCTPALFAVLSLLVALPACDSLYYKTMKKFGVEKRDILVKRVRAARESQQKGKEEFTSALERFKSVVATEGGSLEQKYEALNRELERSEDRADEIHDRVKAVKEVADDLFKEWQRELGQYEDRRLRAESERELAEAMENAEKRVDPVLQPLRDRVLFLKHNLNAAAIGALDKELLALQTNVDALVADLESSIAEAETFIGQMDAEAASTS